MKKISEKALVIQNLTVCVEDKEIVHGVSLTVPSGEFHVIMGPNGSGKSSLVHAVAGHPSYKIRNPKSQIRIDGKNITEAKPEERARSGLMLAFQHPVTIPGVTISNFLRVAYQELHGKKDFNAVVFHKMVLEKMKTLTLDEAFLRRSVNDGFSGGEKKKLEMLQLLVLSPRYAIFDEIDTGLDVDALEKVSSGINTLKKQGVGILLITHYQRILRHSDVDVVYIMVQGKLVKKGSIELIEKIEKQGYAGF